MKEKLKQFWAWLTQKTEGEDLGVRLISYTVKNWLPIVCTMLYLLFLSLSYERGFRNGYDQCYENYKPETYFYTQYVLDTQKSDTCCLTVFCSPMTTDSLEAVEMYKESIDDLEYFLLKDSSQLWRTEFSWRHL